MSGYDLFSILLWAIPSLFMIVAFLRHAYRVDRNLKAGREQRSAVYLEQVRAQLVAQKKQESASR